MVLARRAEECVTDRAMAPNPNLLYCLMLVAYCLFLMFGAWVFSLLEQPREDDVRSALSAARKAFLTEHLCVTEAELEPFLAQVMEARAMGVSVLRNVTGGVQWDLASSLFFVSTTVTTIGFGHPVPISDGGKAFCLLYLIFGIPFSLFVLSITSQKLMILMHDKPIRYIRLHFGFSIIMVTLLHGVAFISLVACLFLFIPACVFSLIEETWSYLDALYFCFISLTTIGLGDYVPGEQAGQRLSALYKVCAAGYLLIGLVAMILVLETLKSILKSNYILAFFLLPSGNAADVQETDAIIPAVSEISVLPSRPKEKARRRLPHSLSPQSDNFYGSIYAPSDS